MTVINLERELPCAREVCALLREIGELPPILGKPGDVTYIISGENTTTNFTYNEFTAMTKSSVTTAYTYNDSGRTVSMSRDGDLTEYEYRYGGKLYNVDTPDADIFYEYNGAGQRVSRLHNDVYTRTDYYWNGWSEVNEYLTISGTPQGWTKTYVEGLAERDEVTAGDPYNFYFTDHLGSTMALYDESKNLAGGVDYTAYGAPIAASGTADGVTRRYTGHDWDSQTEDYFAPYRYYSPNMHRWLTRDPMGMVDGPNVYAYVRGNPAMDYDPFGLWGYVCEYDEDGNLIRCRRWKPACKRGSSYPGHGPADCQECCEEKLSSAGFGTKGLIECCYQGCVEKGNSGKDGEDIWEDCAKDPCTYLSDIPPA